MNPTFIHKGTTYLLFRSQSTRILQRLWISVWLGEFDDVLVLLRRGMNDPISITRKVLWRMSPHSDRTLPSAIRNVREGDEDDEEKAAKMPWEDVSKLSVDVFGRSWREEIAERLAIPLEEYRRWRSDRPGLTAEARSRGGKKSGRHHPGFQEAVNQAVKIVVNRGGRGTTGEVIRVFEEHADEATGHWEPDPAIPDCEYVYVHGPEGSTDDKKGFCFLDDDGEKTVGHRTLRRYVDKAKAAKMGLG